MQGSDLDLLWTILSIIGSVIVSVAVAAWWLKGQLTSGEIKALREQNAAHAAWRQFAEAQLQKVTEELNSAQNQAHKLSRDRQDFQDVATLLLRNLSTASTEVQEVRNRLTFPTPLQAVLGIKPQDQNNPFTLTERSDK
jgi:fumarylacetoacetate (FAA) hydrolase family protein